MDFFTPTKTKPAVLPTPVPLTPIKLPLLNDSPLDVSPRRRLFGTPPTSVSPIRPSVNPLHLQSVPVITRENVWDYLRWLGEYLKSNSISSLYDVLTLNQLYDLYHQIVTHAKPVYQRDPETLRTLNKLSEYMHTRFGA